MEHHVLVFAVSERGLDVLEVWQGGVFGGHEDILQGPVYGQSGVVPADAAFVLRLVVVGAFVGKHGRFRDDDKAVGKARRYVELVVQLA